MKFCNKIGCFNKAARDVSSTHSEDKGSCCNCRKLSSSRRFRGSAPSEVYPVTVCATPGCERLSARVHSNTRPDQVTWCRRCRKAWRSAAQDDYRRRFLQARKIACRPMGNSKERDESISKILELLCCES